MSKRIQLLKFYSRRVQVEMKRAKKPDQNFLLEQLVKEIGLEIQSHRDLKYKSISKGYNFFDFKETWSVDDLHKKFKSFSKYKLSVMQNELWINPHTWDKVRVYGFSGDYILFKDKTVTTNELQSMHAKEFRQQFQLYCNTVECILDYYL